MIELKPCPFCGDTAYLATNTDGFGRDISFYVRCEKSGHTLTADKYDTEEIATEAWNKRSGE
ncbi:MAG: Lar family restriction alleviation protein [Treponema sp.]|nr:Lar family restriction alleviation protein [Treponema sp.]